MLNLKDKRKQVNAKLADLAVATRQVQNEKTNLEDTQDLLSRINDAQVIAQNVAQLVQQKAHNQIAGVVSRCLETVFDQPYVFKIHFERKRGRTEAVLVFERDGLEVDPLTASGGGVVDVAAFVLRLACLVLSKPSLRRIVLLDEPFKFVSKNYLGNVRLLLLGLAKDFNIQFIMVTHLEELVCGKVIRLSDDGVIEDE